MSQKTGEATQVERGSGLDKGSNGGPEEAVGIWLCLEGRANITSKLTNRSTRKET